MPRRGATILRQLDAAIDRQVSLFAQCTQDDGVGSLHSTRAEDSVMLGVPIPVYMDFCRGRHRAMLPARGSQVGLGDGYSKDESDDADYTTCNVASRCAHPSARIRKRTSCHGPESRSQDVIFRRLRLTLIRKRTIALEYRHSRRRSSVTTISQGGNVQGLLCLIYTASSLGWIPSSALP